MSVPKPEGPWLKPGETLLCFGDSLTASTKGYVSLLQNHLEPKGIRVLNAGLGGDKTPFALTRLKPEVIDRKPDAVSLFFGANDAVIGRGEWRDEPVVSPLTYQENLMWIVHLCRLLGNIQKFSINTLPGRMEGKAFFNFGDLRTPYCQAARGAADRMNTRLVPLDTVFQLAWEKNRAQASPEGLLYTVDGIHMTPAGYEMIAQTMLKEWDL
ncbi:MAG: Esterase TesA precursor [Lentisphaerae bacterium ADurb.Bin242]|nr:MAG: Esterase TesA precursor [Lentisphaerae bacterium ADurb.Bin242]